MWKNLKRKKKKNCCWDRPWRENTRRKVKFLRSSNFQQNHKKTDIGTFKLKKPKISKPLKQLTKTSTSDSQNPRTTKRKIILPHKIQIPFHPENLGSPINIQDVCGKNKKGKSTILCFLQIDTLIFNFVLIDP